MAGKIVWVAIAALLAWSAGADDLPRWNIVAGESSLAFVAEQAGAKFRGRFETFDADVRFDASRLSDSRATVVIDMASATTFESERDGILRGEGWFEVERFATARFEADRIERNGDGFKTMGRLVLRDVSHPVEFEFEVTEDGSSRRLDGRARLDRIALGLGLGEWEDPAWIGADVTVEVTLVAKREENRP